jgi:hypothetical protein
MQCGALIALHDASLRQPQTLYGLPRACSWRLSALSMTLAHFHVLCAFVVKEAPMAFATADFKKTTRTAGEAKQLYPYQIKDGRYAAAIGYAIAYYERMVGRRRGEFEADTLLEFFGDPRLARGLVACLARTYQWRAQTLAEALGEDVARALRAAQVSSPADVRARLYGLANGRYNGFILPKQRPEALGLLCERLNNPENAPAGPRTTVTPAHVEAALTLDAEDRQVLVKTGQMPEPDEIVARYNYHSLETALVHSSLITLQLRGPVWSMIRSAHALARRYRLRYEVSGAPKTLFDEQAELTLHGAKDAFGGWSRTGRRLARAVLRLIAAHPGGIVGGAARVQIKGQPLIFRLDERALTVLGAGASAEVEAIEAWDEDEAEALRRAWSRAYVAGKTAGWRLRRDPEPLVGAGASTPLLVVPDFALVRGREKLALCLAGGPATAEALLGDLGKLGQRAQAFVVLPAHVAEGLRSCPAPAATYVEQPPEAIPSLVAMLERAHPRGAADAPTPWRRLERLAAEEGFVPEEQVAELLGCQRGEAAKLVQRWGGTSLHALPGLGVCPPAMLEEIRALIEDGTLGQKAA